LNPAVFKVLNRFFQYQGGRFLMPKLFESRFFQAIIVGKYLLRSLLAKKAALNGLAKMADLTNENSA
jgi:hypothetical protein